jgi:hypothetical protein
VRNNQNWYQPYLLELLHVSLHRQGRTVGVTGAVTVGGVRVRSFVVHGGLPCVSPIRPREPEGAAHIPRAAPAGVARRDGLADAPQTLLRHGEVLVGGWTKCKIPIWAKTFRVRRIKLRPDGRRSRLEGNRSGTDLSGKGRLKPTLHSRVLSCRSRDLQESPSRDSLKNTPQACSICICLQSSFSTWQCGVHVRVLRLVGERFSSLEEGNVLPCPHSILSQVGFFDDLG